MSKRPDGVEELPPAQQLKPCPFDGGTRLVVCKTLRDGYPVGDDDPDAYAFNVHCTSCACDGPWKKSQGGAELFWNGLPGTKRGGALP